MRLLVCLQIAIMLACCSLASARTWYVRPDGTGDVPTIKTAVDSAADGDTLLLADGTFYMVKDVDCLDKAIAIISESRNPALCRIDQGSGVAFEDAVVFYLRAESPGAQKLEGLTISGGCGAVICDTSACPAITNCVFRDNVCLGAEIIPWGAALRCYPNSAPTITTCTFMSNSSGGGSGIDCDRSFAEVTDVTFSGNWGGFGGGMASTGGLPRLERCVFSGNSAGNPFTGPAGGAGFGCDGSAELIDCVFENNTCSAGVGAGIFYMPEIADNHMTVTGCVFTGNRVDDWVPGGGAGMAVGDQVPSVAMANVTITNCTFSDNYAEAANQGACIYFSGKWNVQIENTIIAFSSRGAGIRCFAYGQGTITASCTDIFGNAGGNWLCGLSGQSGVNGNFSGDPLFCDRENGDFMLKDCSPCLSGHHPAGYDCGEMIGARGVGCECNTATVPSTWGAIKAIFK
jgi:Right handed beta helix region